MIAKLQRWDLVHPLAWYRGEAGGQLNCWGEVSSGAVMSYVYFSSADALPNVCFEGSDDELDDSEPDFEALEVWSPFHHPHLESLLTL